MSGGVPLLTLYPVTASTEKSYLLSADHLVGGRMKLCSLVGGRVVVTVAAEADSIMQLFDSRDMYG
jgi:hypothetical protein